MDVVIYARYSSHNQTEQSIDGQLEVDYKYCEKNNFNVVGVYIDRAKSGTKDDRKDFLRMIEDSKSKTKTWQGIVVYQLDRFARNKYDSVVYKRDLKKNGVRVFSAMENISSDASGILMESVLEGMAEYFSVELGQKVKRGMGINAESCYYNGGTVPLGLKLIEVDSNITDAHGKIVKKKKYDIDEETAPIIKKVFEMYNEGSLMADIIRYLNNQQLKTATGKEFNKSSIRGLLTNKKYIGIYSYNGEETLDGIPRIIDDDVFNTAQDTLNIKKLAPARARAKTEYLLTTKLFCGYCESIMTGTSGTSKSGKLHTYYHCVTAKKEKTCHKKTVQKDYIENIIVEKARSMLTDENIDMIANIVYDLAEKERNSSTIKRLNRLLKEKDKQKANLFDKLKLCDIDSVTKAIFEEISKLEQEKSDIEKSIINEQKNCVDVTKTQIKTFLKALRNGNKNDPRYRKNLINVLIYKVYLYDDNFTVYFTTQNKKYEGKLPTLKEMENFFKEQDVRLTADVDCQMYIMRTPFIVLWVDLRLI